MQHHRLPLLVSLLVSATLVASGLAFGATVTPVAGPATAAYLPIVFQGGVPMIATQTQSPTVTLTRIPSSEPTGTEEPSVVSTETASTTSTPSLTPTNTPPPIIEIVNGDFEQGPSVGWRSDTDRITTQVPQGIQPHGGQWLLALDDSGGANTKEELLYQTEITVPTTAPYLSYWVWIVSTETLCGRDRSALGVGNLSTGGVLRDQFILCTTSNTNGWTKRVLDLTAYAGQHIQIGMIETTTSPVANSQFYVDDITFQESATQ